MKTNFAYSDITDELCRSCPVRHGLWIDKGEYAVCIECGGRSGTQYNGVEPLPLMTKFCPNCGAKMYGRENENDRNVIKQTRFAYLP